MKLFKFEKNSKQVVIEKAEKVLCLFHQEYYYFSNLFFQDTCCKTNVTEVLSRVLSRHILARVLIR